MMFDIIKRLWEEGKINEVGLRRAVEKDWITPEQFAEICGIPY